jgi:hypothetical protein
VLAVLVGIWANRRLARRPRHDPGVEANARALPQGRACRPDGVSVVALGWLLGETSDRIYFGGPSPTNGPYVVWVPASKVHRVVVDYEKPASELKC